MKRALSLLAVFCFCCNLTFAQENVNTPENLDECFLELKEIWTPQELKEFREINEDEVVRYHHGVGTWIRNNWGLWSESLLAKYFNSLGIHHPDDMSSIILISFHRSLNDNEIRLQEQIKHYQDYWNDIHKKEFDKYYSDLLSCRENTEVKLSSKSSDYNDCEAFRKIVKRGKLFLPFIVEKIKQGDFFLNQAMQEITSVDIKEYAKTQDILSEQRKSELWVRWWDENKVKYD